MSRGAYGLTLTGVDPAALNVLPPDTDWPAVAVSATTGDERPATRIGSEDAMIALRDGGFIQLDRGERTVHFTTPARLADDALVHPYLAPAAAVFARWHEHETFHAGAFVAGGRAWAVAAPSGGGKSTTLAALEAAGVGIVADDLLVVGDRGVFAGPRSIDLRGPGEGPLVRDGERRRRSLSAVPLELPVAGWFFLTWGPELDARALPPGERVPRISGQRSVSDLATADVILEAMTLPAWEVSRPKSLDSVAATVGRLRELVGG